MLPTDHFILSLLPFALPLQTPYNTGAYSLCAAAAMLPVLGAMELLAIKLRRLL